MICGLERMLICLSIQTQRTGPGTCLIYARLHVEEGSDRGLGFGV